MSMRSLLLWFLLTVVVDALVQPAIGAELSQAEVAALSRSVVQVIAEPGSGRSQLATGFVFERGDCVVTAYHAVAGCQRITVYSASLGANYEARLKKVLKSADLALLELTRSTDLTPLQTVEETPDFNRELVVLGHALGAPTVLPGTLRIGGSRTLKDITPEAAEQEIRSIGVPSLSSTVFHLMGPLVPGHSGAPVFNHAGKVIAIGDGGLERGAASISWAIPAARLRALLQSGEALQTTARAGAFQNLFAADLRTDIGERTLDAGSVELRKLRTRTLGEMRRSSASDDMLGLMQLLPVGAPFDVDALRFDIYADAESGATLVVPAGMRLDSRDGLMLGYLDSRRLEFRVRVEEVNSMQEAQFSSLAFEQTIFQSSPQLQWLDNPQWSYPTPRVFPSGLTVRRKSFLGGQFDPRFGWNWTKFCLETLAMRSDVMLCVAAIKHDFAGNQPPSANWVSLLIGTHLTTFSNLTTFSD